VLHETFNWKSLSIIGGLTWYEGTRASRPEEMDEDMAWPAEGGVLFKGSKGKMLCDHVGMNPKLLPLSRHLEYKRPPRTLPRVPGNRHEMEWVNAIKNNTKCGTDFEYAGQKQRPGLSTHSYPLSLGLEFVDKRPDGRLRGLLFMDFGTGG
jgi:hypothetical protein